MTKKKPNPTPPLEAVTQKHHDHPRNSWVAPADDGHWIHLSLEQRDSIHELCQRGWYPQFNTLSHVLLKQSVQILCRAHETGSKCWFVIEKDGTTHS